MQTLLLDIETFPQLGYTWVSFDTNVIAIKEHWKICSYSAKWIGGEQVTHCLTDVRNEKQLVAELWSLLDAADVVIAHNGDNFDLRKINARFLVHKFCPPTPYRTIDTKKSAKRVFGFSSNSLDNLCEQLGIGRKINTEGFDLWRSCMANDAAAWERMKKYNAHDVVLLEGLYYRLRPWMKTHPAGEEGCSRCGSKLLQKRGFATKLTRKYQRLQCTSCGGWMQDTKGIAYRSTVSA